MNEPESTVRPEPQEAKSSGVAAIFQTAIISALVAGGMVWTLMQHEIVPLKEELAARPPVAVVDFGALALSFQNVGPGEIDQKVQQMRADVKKLSNAGFLVLDAQSVLGAPEDLYLRSIDARERPATNTAPLK